MGSLLSRLGGDAGRIIAAMNRSQAIIEFSPTGDILDANDNFCKAMGYERTEIIGRHHRMFVEPAEAESTAYREFWARLARGDYDRHQYKRIAKGGRDVWIEASYNPVQRAGKTYKVVKFATDITDTKRRAAEDAGKLAAISRSQAVIEFQPDGTIIGANANFCSAMGYELSEIVGKHHRMFCEPGYVASDDYREFWPRLARGEFMANEYLRIGKGGREIWIQAAYNPICDLNGRVFKVVKFATDVTERMGAIAALGTSLRALSEGDLCQKLERPFVPTMERVRIDYNEAVARLRAAMSSVGENARGIASGSAEVRTAADDLARRTEQQAASVEETAAALDEITTAVTDTSRRAEEAGRLVASARKSAERSGEVVRNAITAMHQIEKSSDEISSIIGMIDEIAFQTNLLALNAGVEAARAGDAGRGFAVVAQEVRELAQRSAAAAKEIKALIATSGEQVGNGVALVGETGEVLQEIAGQVRDIDANVTAIVGSAREQATGLKEVNQAVMAIDQGTQQNAAMVEETTAASRNLANEAEALFELLGQFRTGANPGPQAVEPGRPVRAVPSPARKLTTQLARAVGARTPLPADGWEEF